LLSSIVTEFVSTNARTLKRPPDDWMFGGESTPSWCGKVGDEGEALPHLCGTAEKLPRHLSDSGRSSSHPVVKVGDRKEVYRRVK
jgi:hypothetical protein